MELESYVLLAVAVALVLLVVWMWFRLLHKDTELDDQTVVRLALRREIKNLKEDVETWQGRLRSSLQGKDRIVELQKKALEEARSAKEEVERLGKEIDDRDGTINRMGVELAEAKEETEEVRKLSESAVNAVRGMRLGVYLADLDDADVIDKVDFILSYDSLKDEEKVKEGAEEEEQSTDDTLPTILRSELEEWVPDDATHVQFLGSAFGDSSSVSLVYRKTLEGWEYAGFPSNGVIEWLDNEEMEGPDDPMNHDIRKIVEDVDTVEDVEETFTAR